MDLVEYQGKQLFAMPTEVVEIAAEIAGAPAR